jgi:hypothetical protein
MRHDSQATSDLANHITETLYGDWKTNRQATLEVKWEKNINAFKSISEGAWKKDEGEGWRSDTFIDVTRQKVVAAYALVIEQLLANERVPFMLELSPHARETMEREDPDAEDAVDDNIEAMTELIKEQLLLAKADREKMKEVMSAAVYGETYSKRVVDSVTNRYFAEVPVEGVESGVPTESVRFQEVEEERVFPSCQYVSVWDVFRDWETENLREGTGIIHRQMVSPYFLRQKMGGEFFIDENIESVLRDHEAGDQSSVNDNSISPALRDLAKRKNNLEYLEFWGRAPRRIVEKFESESETDDYSSILGDLHDDGDEVEIHCCVVNNVVVRYTRSTPEDRPFYRAVWENRIDDVCSQGIADNVEPLQKVVNGIFRSLEDNIRLTNNVTFAVKERFVDDDSIEFKPGAKIPIADECDDVRKALQQFIVNDVTGSTFNFLGVTERFLDESSGVPKIAQGMAPVNNKTETAYEISQQTEKSGKYLGQVLRNMDEGLIEPEITDIYRYNMLDPNVTVGKGSYVVKALGFASFQDRVKRVEKLQRFLTIIMSSEALTGVSKLDHILRELAKALDLDDDQVMKSREELQAEAEAGADPQRQLEMNRLQAEIQRMMSESKAREAGIAFDQEKLKMDRAKLVKDIERGETSKTSEKNEQGPYIEKGMSSNNERPHPVGG